MFTLDFVIHKYRCQHSLQCKYNGAFSFYLGFLSKYTKTYYKCQWENVGLLKVYLWSFNHNKEQQDLWHNEGKIKCSLHSITLRKSKPPTIYWSPFLKLQIIISELLKLYTISLNSYRFLIHKNELKQFVD